MVVESRNGGQSGGKRVTFIGGFGIRLVFAETDRKIA
jgi:hypothetical protein